MTKRSKRYKENLALIDKEKVYSPDEAIKLLKKLKNPKFDSTLEVHIKLNIDPQKSDQQLKGTVVLPYGTGKKKKIAAFVRPDKEKEAKEAGAEIVGGEELVKEIQTTKKCDFDVSVAEPAMMKALAPIAKILGPRGLMPNPKTETVGEDVKKMIKDLAGGKVSFKVDTLANIHQALGKISQETKELIENFEVFLKAVLKARPEGAKGNLIKVITLTTTMGPGLRVKV